LGSLVADDTIAPPAAEVVVAVRVALYLRVSTDDKGQTVENQRLPLREFCAAQGWTDVREYADEASATDVRGRKAWRLLLDDAAKRKVDLILVWRMDRMARSVLDAAQTLERLRGWGVGLRSYCEPYLDTTSPFGEALFHITMAYAQLERGILSERTRAGMERARRQGKHIGRPPVTERPGFAERWAEVRVELEAGRLSRSQACRKLEIGYATLLRLLDTGRSKEVAVS
jgi:DNA invertase Pin-like site-specific DNA recombinase